MELDAPVQCAAGGEEVGGARLRFPGAGYVLRGVDAVAAQCGADGVCAAQAERVVGGRVAAGVGMADALDAPGVLQARGELRCVAVAGGVEGRGPAANRPSERITCRRCGSTVVVLDARTLAGVPSVAVAVNLTRAPPTVAMALRPVRVSATVTEPRREPSM